MVVVLFALGLMCKPTLVTLPFVLLLLDYWPLRRFAMQSTRPKNPALNPKKPVEPGDGKRSAGGSLLHKIGRISPGRKDSLSCALGRGGVWQRSWPKDGLITMHQLTFGDRVANALVSSLFTLRQMIWPTDLSVVYPYPQGGWSMVQVSLALLALLIMSASFFTWRGRYPFLLIGWLWFLGMLVPMIGIVQVGLQARADRYTYLPQIGLYLLLTWGAMELFSKWRRGRAGLIALSLLMVIVLMADACFQTSFWRNSETLWNRALACTSNSYIAQNNLGDTLMRQEGDWMKQSPICEGLSKSPPIIRMRTTILGMRSPAKVSGTMRSCPSRQPCG